jgi:hypothetical protein
MSVAKLRTQTQERPAGASTLIAGVQAAPGYQPDPDLADRQARLQPRALGIGCTLIRPVLDIIPDRQSSHCSFPRSQPQNLLSCESHPRPLLQPSPRVTRAIFFDNLVWTHSNNLRKKQLELLA